MKGMNRPASAFQLVIVVKFVVIVALLLASYLAAQILTPTKKVTPLDFDVKQQLPARFSAWQQVDSPFMQVSVATENQPYDLVEMVNYQHQQGHIIMLALAWGQQQTQELKIHQPPLCYKAQGYKVETLTPQKFNLGNNSPVQLVAGVTMTTRNGYGIEVVNYWMRIGDFFSTSGQQTRQHIFQQGLTGHIPDGILVRASTRAGANLSEDEAATLLAHFLKDFVSASSEPLQQLMLQSGEPNLPQIAQNRLSERNAGHEY
ncbi:EpsI family protein [Neiella marina]|uniref:EpsI family protein n=1 Tax=Neiella holothuriorum TaxID=2870530 RepID=A0ABS7EFX4_9GAMM|nr:exosortase C-terminal domain/associated protein EpsI [Neiella holothuriorum]MBW8190582.1 EpsI family protein [Neiella holothuriorum]